MPDKFDQQTYLPDIKICVRPTVQITLSRYVFYVGDTAIVTFTFSDPPLGFTVDDILADNGILSDFRETENPLVYTAIFTPLPDVLDLTNVITVGIGWMSWAYKTPVDITLSDNYILYTLLTTSIVRITTTEDLRVTPEGYIRVVRL